mmetsp:Transcript_27181/g.56603  ORF Transcript_27181/g.56603 Transcript_27181/m.56603 type:complete len:232 (+) Transcript_27181:477-1172(+)
MKLLLHRHFSTIVLQTFHGFPITSRSTDPRAHPRGMSFPNLFQRRQRSVGNPALRLRILPEETRHGAKFARRIRIRPRRGGDSRIVRVDPPSATTPRHQTTNRRVHVPLRHGIGTTRLLHQHGRQRPRLQVLGHRRRLFTRDARSALALSLLLRLALGTATASSLPILDIVQLCKLVVLVVLVSGIHRVACTLRHPLQNIHVNCHAILPFLQCGRRRRQRIRHRPSRIVAV